MNTKKCFSELKSSVSLTTVKNEYGRNYYFAEGDGCTFAVIETTDKKMYTTRDWKGLQPNLLDDADIMKYDWMDEYGRPVDIRSILITS